MARKRLVAVDAETNPIESRPDYPPRAVGYAIRPEGRKSVYLAFGHPTENNCTRAEAVARIKEEIRDATPVFHHADFDTEVLAKDGVRVRGPYHDTMRLAFINEPRSIDLGLKPQAAVHLGRPADEQNMLRNWIIENIPEAKKRPARWANYICKAPGKIVGRYAGGDTDRTLDLLFYYMEELGNCDDKYPDESRMLDSYQLEMDLIPIKLDMEQQGIRVRRSKLKRELPAYRKAFAHLDKQIARRLKRAGAAIDDEFNIGSSKQLADALLEADLLSNVVLTKTGKVSTKRINIEENCADKDLTLMLAMRSTLKTYLSSFMENWLDVAERNDGYVQPTFNTVRRSEEAGGARRGFGARTGRFSSSDPNFQNVPSNAADSPHKATLAGLTKLLRSYGVEFVGLRDYFEPDEGCVFIRRDYNQQELRILAHRENGPFLEMYRQNPRLDAHDAVRLLVLQATGVDYPRKHIKQTNFGILYGMGLLKLALRLGITLEEAKALRKAVLTAIPGVKTIQKRMQKLADRGEPFFTWGGRRYFCEDPIYIPLESGGKIKKTFEYKMMNTDIQGSAADCTKRGMRQVHQNFRHARIVLQVHDELLASVPRQYARVEMERMREAMEDMNFNVPMLSDGETGGVSWARMKKVIW